MTRLKPIKTGLLIAISALGLSGCMDGQFGHYNSLDDIPTSFSSEGERLYFIGVSSNGEQIRSVGGNHHMQMHGGTCATCHGADKKGGAIMWPRFWLTAPALTHTALQKEHNDGHSHASYDRESLKNAIVNGKGPDGSALHPVMPRWRMSEQSLNALADYLLEQDSH